MALTTQDDGVVECESAPLGSSANPLHTIWTIPNLITFIRLVLTFVFVFLFQETATRLAGIIIFIIAASTDWVDGQVARRFNQVSVFGKRFDPYMDRVLICCAILALLLSGLIPLWLFLILLFRDVYLAIGTLYLQLTGRPVVEVVYVGKVCTFVLEVGFAIVLLGWWIVPGLGLCDWPWLFGFNHAPCSIGIFVVYVGLILSLITASIYTKLGFETCKSNPRCLQARP